MRDLIQLPADRRIDMRMSMTVDVTPQATDSVQQLTPLRIVKPNAFRPLDNQRLVLGHLGESVPVMLAVPRFQLITGGPLVVLCWSHDVTRRILEWKLLPGNPYQETSTRAPTWTPSIALALSSTKEILIGPESAAIATKVMEGC